MTVASVIGERTSASAAVVPAGMLATSHVAVVWSPLSVHVQSPEVKDVSYNGLAYANYSAAWLDR